MLARSLPQVEIDLLRRGLSRQPHSPALLQALGLALLSDGQYAESATVLASATVAEPTVDGFHGLGRALKAAGNTAAARDAFEQALRIAPHSASVLVSLARVLRALGDDDGALQAARRGLDAGPLRSDLLEFLARVLPRAGRAEELLDAAEHALAVDAGHTAAWYGRAVALAALDRHDDAARIMDRRLVRVADVQPPHPWTDLAAFCADLQQHIIANPTLQYEPHDKSTRHGLQTRELMAGQPAALVALLSAFRVEVEQYVAQCREWQIPCSVVTPPARVQMHAWATVLDAAGHQETHIHRAGWVSGVYYVTDGGAASGRGVLRVPTSPRGTDDSRDWPCEDIEPRVGRLVLFPSYFPHRTVPTGTTQPRISVAFDVVAVGAQA